MKDYVFKLRCRFSVECEGVEQHARTLQVDGLVTQHQLDEARRGDTLGGGTLRYRMEHAAHNIVQGFGGAMRGDSELHLALVKALADALSRVEHERRKG